DRDGGPVDPLDRLKAHVELLRDTRGVLTYLVLVTMGPVEKPAVAVGHQSAPFGRVASNPSTSTTARPAYNAQIMSARVRWGARPGTGHAVGDAVAGLAPPPRPGGEGRPAVEKADRRRFDRVQQEADVGKALELPRAHCRADAPDEERRGAAGERPRQRDDRV